MNTIEQHWQILLAGWRQWRNVHTPWVFVGVVGVLGLLTLGWGFAGTDIPLSSRIDAALSVIRFVSWGALMALWLNLFLSLRRQNSPATARLVPHHAEQVRWTLVTSWVVAGGLLGCIAASGTGHLFFWIVLSLGALSLLVLMTQHLGLAIVLSALLPPGTAYVTQTPAWRAMLDTIASLYQQQPVWAGYSHKR